jgi:hypothetical protein
MYVVDLLLLWGCSYWWYCIFQGEGDENDEEEDNGDSGRMDGDYEYEGSGDNKEEDNEAEDGEGTEEEGDEEEDINEVDEDETSLHGEHRMSISIILTDMFSLQLHHHLVKRRNWPTERPRLLQLLSLSLSPKLLHKNPLSFRRIFLPRRKTISQRYSRQDGMLLLTSSVLSAINIRQTIGLVKWIRNIDHWGDHRIMMVLSP